MSLGWVVLIIAIVLAVIISNIMLLKQSAKMPFKSSLSEANEAQRKADNEKPQA
ncbi:DUF2897 family protein [Alteromonas facilis]|uniref:DUF2897 family protein n=1 Tax=Alteromonas facilis TaxID=2048004 RepID=UPI000C28B969|nr:DUF2897 family protein [Alteromonas facilis]